MRKTISTQKGFALLYVMLILASVIVALSLAASRSGVFSATRTRTNFQSADLRMVAQYCAENLLMQVRNNTALISSGSLSYNGGTCTYTVAGASPTKVITITATEYNLYRRLTVTTTAVTPLILSSWIEGS